jgi:hypothetical protein
MKKTLLTIGIAGIALMGFHGSSLAQGENLNLVHITKLKAIMPEDGSFGERDSLIAIYNKNVINKNDLILSHFEYGHFFTSDSQDYLVVEEFKSFSSWEEAVKKNSELEEAAWPDEDKRNAFMDSMDKYFKDWHGDMLMRVNPELSKK